jgi:hypothetical protein
MSDEKVIHAFPANELPENLMAIEPKPVGVPYFCDHPAVRLNEHNRTVNCAKCGASLDPFNFLRNEARTIQRAWENHRAAQQKVNELNARIEALTKEEKRLRAQVKRLQEKSGEVLQVRGRSIL